MNIFSRLLARLGYVRLKDYGYALSPGGKIVEVVQVDDDRFAPPPWQPVAWQTATSLLPPAPSRPPSPRPLPPPPDAGADGEEPAPLFRVPAVPATVETAPPGNTPDEEFDEDAISIDEAPEDEEWEWKMALARAREAADKERERTGKRKETAAVRAAAAPTPPFRTSALPLSAPPPRKVVENPRPMSRIARPEPRISTDRPVAAKTTPRTAPPKAPPGRTSRPMAAVTAAVRPAPERTPARSSLEKSVSRVFSPATPSTNGAAGKARPLPRLARGTEHPARDGRPTQPRMALGSGRLAAVRDPSHDVTATDITAVDRAEASMRSDEEDTRVNVVLGSSPELTLDLSADGDPEVENTMVDQKPKGVGIVSVTDGSSPLPRLTARLRRPSVPN